MPIKAKLITYAILALATSHFALETSHAALLYLYPQTIDIFEGESTFIDVRINTEGATINAAEIEGAMLGPGASVESVSSVNNIFPIFIEALETKEDNFRYIGGAPNGFNGNDLVGRLEVKGLAPGTSIISFAPSSKILEHGPSAVTLKTSFLQSFINVLSKESYPSYIELSSRTHPSQSEWSKETDVNIHWNLVENKQYSYIVSMDPTENPDNNPDFPEGDLEFQGDIALENLPDGIHYFAIKEIDSDIVSKYRILIDTTNPSWLEVVISPGIPETDNKDFLSFAATDNLSGISHYEVSVDDAEFVRTASPYILPEVYSSISIHAFDQAGNSIDKTIKTTEPASVKFLYGITFLILLGFASAFLKRIDQREHEPNKAKK